MSEYFLQVDLVVHERDCNAFEERMKAFMTPHRDGDPESGGFDRIDPKSTKKLVLALKAKESIACHGYKHRQHNEHKYRDSRATADPNMRDHRRYVHVWLMDDLKDLDLARLMTLCADDKEYRDLDALVVRETQNFVFRVPWLSDLPALDAQPKLQVFRVTRQLTTKELGTYLFSLGALIPTLESGSGPRSMGFFQSVTGLLNTVIEYWQADDTSDARLEPILRPPEKLTADVVGSDSPILDVYKGVPVSFLCEDLESYLPAQLMEIRHINRNWK